MNVLLLQTMQAITEGTRDHRHVSCESAISQPETGAQTPCQV